MKTKLALFLAIFVTCIAVSQSFFAPAMPQKHLSITRLHMADVSVNDPEKGVIVDFADFKVSRKSLIEEDDESMICEYLVELDFPGKESQQFYNELEAEARAEGFKGFRKGKIPPHVLKDLKACCLERTIAEAVENAMDFCKIEVACDEDDIVVCETIEDINELFESFEPGKNFKFSASVVGREQKPEKVSKVGESAEEVIDTEVV
eukprot:CAMPEP_0113943066 /NCGR_PEP_ID=MMETSP1339-20121228/19055_1 /TAXON_ID=94617 /ORGANISM="Fibrocapsa japonica" /LENGTH=205 /DNA_ID=CAMNT_0000947823 /DNA_START=82 /DNA_END=699 /DNA_ORIENTATION=- /assembly_acc=CAM_ASM_000762